MHFACRYQFGAAATAAAAASACLRRIYKMHIFCLCFFDYSSAFVCVCALARRLGAVSQYPIASHFKPKSCKKCACAIGERHLMMMLLPRLLLLAAAETVADAALWLRLQFCALLLLAH